MDSSDMAVITLMGRGDILFLYTDGVFDGSDVQERQRIGAIIDEHKQQSAKDICNAILDYAVKRDVLLRQEGHSDEIDDKTVFIIKRT
jgi:serine phosphatase RsbU (regulator of sigma subunit)